MFLGYLQGVLFIRKLKLIWTCKPGWPIHTNIISLENSIVSYFPVRAQELEKDEVQKSLIRRLLEKNTCEMAFV